MSPTLLLTWLTLTAVSPAQAPDSTTSSFVGALRIGDRSWLWEGWLEEELSGELAGRGRVSAEVTMGFDAVIGRSDLEGRAVETSPGSGGGSGRFRLRLTTPWQDVELVGRVDTERVEAWRDPLEGKHPGVSLRLERISDVEEAMADSLVGLWASAQGTALLTWREGGGLRWIDLESGEAESWRRLDDGWRRVTPSGIDSDRVRVELDPEDARLIRGRERWRRLDELTQERVRFAAGDLELAGTLLLPSSSPQGPLPGLVLVHGSGPIYRTALAERAVAFARRGFVVLIYDKRGTGESGGSWRDAGHHDLARDARGAIDLLRGRPERRDDAVGFYGHSEAGWVIPHAGPAAFVVVASGGGARTAETELYQKGLEVRRHFDEARARELEDFLAAVLAWGAADDVDREALERRFREAAKEPWFEITDLPALDRLPEWSAAPPEMLAWRKELQERPADAIAELRCPVLVIFGERDERVPVDAALEGWRSGTARAGVALTVELLDGADHSLRVERREGRTLHPELVPMVERWIRQQLPVEH